MSLQPQASSQAGLPHVLAVDDDPVIRELIADYLGQNDLRVTTVADGAAMREVIAEQVVDLIVLDLNLPKKDGREVLAAIKADDSLKRIPVVVLTTSQDEQDVLRSYNLHANCYITKPVDLDQFIRVVRSIEDFWLGIVVLPVPPQNGTK